MQIKMVIFDIDGVITDGKLTIDAKGNEYKSMDFRDIDAIFALKRNGYKIAFVTGENTEITNYFKNTFTPDYFYSGNKDKANAVREISEKSGIILEEICYIGDGKYDAAPMELTGYSACPNNAIELVKETAKIHLNSSGGNGCIHELVNLIFENRLIKTNEGLNEQGFSEEAKKCLYKPYEVKESDTKHILRIDEIFKEHYDLIQALMSSHEIKEKIGIIISKLVKCIDNKGHIMICGNGGSAADAQHIAAEFVGRFFLERPAFSCESLTTNTSILTAVGNDYSFDSIFSRQVEAKAKQDDVLIGLSTSGRSVNVINAFKSGKKCGTFNIAFVGNSSNAELDKYCDVIVEIPSKITPRIQEMHMFLNHMICELAEERLCNK